MRQGHISSDFPTVLSDVESKPSRW